MTESDRYTDLCCPACGKAIVVDFTADRVEACEHFPAARIENGIAALLEKHDFYEGRFSGVDELVLPRNPSLLRKTMLYLRHSSLAAANRFFLWKWLERAASGGKPLNILDVGCGSGKRLLGEYGEVYGIDYSVESLAGNQGLYREVLQCDSAAVPYPSGHFDFVLSDNVLGHVPFEQKPAVFNEISRLLRPGGLTLHVAEAMCVEYYALHRLDAEAFRENCIEHNGHIGLETSAAIDARFRATGLECRYAAHGHILAMAKRYAEHYGGAFARRHLWARLISRVSGTIAGVRLLAAVFDRGMRFANAALRTLAPLKAPAGCLFWGVYQKPRS